MTTPINPKPNAIAYFTAGAVPTAPEQAAIDAFIAAAVQPLVLQVRNGGADPLTANPEEEIVKTAGTTVPTAFSALPHLADAAATNAFLPLATQAIVKHNVDIVVPVTGTFVSKIKATVVNNVITGFVMS